MGGGICIELEDLHIMLLMWPLCYTSENWEMCVLMNKHRHNKKDYIAIFVTITLSNHAFQTLYTISCPNKLNIGLYLLYYIL